MKSQPVSLLQMDPNPNYGFLLLGKLFAANTDISALETIYLDVILPQINEPVDSTHQNSAPDDVANCDRQQVTDKEIPPGEIGEFNSAIEVGYNTGIS